MESPSTTHPTSSESPLEVSREEFVNDICNAVSHATLLKATPFSSVTVLMTIWDRVYNRNEEGMRDDYLRMSDLMTKHFGFWVKELKFASGVMGSECVATFKDSCAGILPKRGELLIFYYIGHSSLDPLSDCFKGIYFCPQPYALRVKPNVFVFPPVYIGFHESIAKPLDESEGEVLYILDSSTRPAHPTSASTSGIDQDPLRLSTHATFTYDRNCGGMCKHRETLLATDTGQPARSPGFQTFTSAFCEAVRTLQRPATTWQIHRCMKSAYISRYKCKGLAKTPVHIPDFRDNKSSVLLAPLTRNIFMPPRGIGDGHRNQNSHALIMATLNNCPKTTQQFNDWLKGLTVSSAHEIMVHSMFYKDDKCRILLHMPVLLWNVLAEKRYYNLIGYLERRSMMSTKREDLEAESRLLEELERDLRTQDTSPTALKKAGKITAEKK